MDWVAAQRRHLQDAQATLDRTFAALVSEAGSAR
jgi:hypothetical protein